MPSEKKKENDMEKESEHTTVLTRSSVRNQWPRRERELGSTVGPHFLQVDFRLQVRRSLEGCFYKRKKKREKWKKKKEKRKTEEKKKKKNPYGGQDGWSSS